MSPITKLRILYILSKTFHKSKELSMNMKLSTNLIIQVLALVVQAANQLGALMPEHRIEIALGLGLVQSIVAIVVHFSNTNGTAQELPGGSAALKK